MIPAGLAAGGPADVTASVGPRATTSLFREEFFRQKECSMLVLSRKTSERIRIGDEIVVTIVRIGPNSVRIGIEAPRDTNIVREELCNFANPEQGHPVVLQSE
jgi:carbon storage regulator